MSTEFILVSGIVPFFQLTLLPHSESLWIVPENYPVILGRYTHGPILPPLPNSLFVFQFPAPDVTPSGLKILSGASAFVGPALERMLHPFRSEIFSFIPRPLSAGASRPRRNGSD